MRCLSSALARSLPSWLRVGCWGLCKQGLFMPTQHSPLFFSCYDVLRDLRSHPTRRYSDLARGSPDPPWHYGEHRTR